MLELSNCSSKFLPNSGLYDLLIFKWSNFYHIRKENIRNLSFDDHMQNFDHQSNNQSIKLANHYFDISFEYNQMIELKSQISTW